MTISNETAPMHTPLEQERRRYVLPVPTEKMVEERNLALFEQVQQGKLSYAEFQAKQQEIFDFKSSFDTMTSDLFNKKGFLLFGEKIFEHAKEQKIPLLMIVADGRSFKQINDHYGHTIGDAAIMGMGAGIHHSLRTTDLISHLQGDEVNQLVSESADERISELAADPDHSGRERRVDPEGASPHTFQARFGGDEFVIMLTGADLIDMWQIIPKLRKNIPEYVRLQVEQQLKKTGLSFDVSALEAHLDFGLALYDPQRHHTLTDLFSDADRALYKIKEAIKNRNSEEARDDMIGQLDPNNPENVLFLGIH